MTNEEVKQQAIKNAYGEYWDVVKDEIIEGGFAPYKLLEDSVGITFEFKQFHIVFGSPETYVRPSLLRGIENNNGWIKIESENDLPKEPYGKYEVYSNNSIFSQIPKIQGIDDFWQNDENKKQDWMNSYTYYKPIILSKPPIY